MIEALIAGERDPQQLAGRAKGRLRAKLDALELACDGRFTASPAQMCRLHMAAYDRLTAEIATLDALVAEAAVPFEAVIARLITIPGIGRRIAGVIVAETGAQMARFATSAKLAAWAGLAPGSNESAGKRKRAAARNGNQHLRGDGRSSMGGLPHRHPPRCQVPAAALPVRQAQPQESRRRCRPHPGICVGSEMIVTIGVDTHTDVHVAAVLDQAGRLLATELFPATTRGYARLATWAESFGTVDKVGMEGTGHFGAELLRFLADYGLVVAEVNRPDRSARRKESPTR
jgi:transposase